MLPGQRGSHLARTPSQPMGSSRWKSTFSPARFNHLPQEQGSRRRGPSVPAKGSFCFNPLNWHGTAMLPNGPLWGQLYPYYGILLDVFGLRFSALLTSLN